MTRQKYHEMMVNLEKCHKVVQQSGAKGIRVDKIAEKLGVHRTTVYSYLNTLEYKGKVESSHGIWLAKTEEQTIQPLEKEIVIELPLPENEVQRIAAMEYLNNWGGANDPEDRSLMKFLLEKFRETRTIRIKGKNVDNLDLEKLGKLIREANEKSSKFSLKRLLKRVRR